MLRYRYRLVDHNNPGSASPVKLQRAVKIDENHVVLQVDAADGSGFCNPLYYSTKAVDIDVEGWDNSPELAFLTWQSKAYDETRQKVEKARQVAMDVLGLKFD